MPRGILRLSSTVAPSLQPGNHTFLFSVTGTSGGWGAAWRSGVHPNNPLTHVALPALPHAGPLPPVHSFLNVSAASASSSPPPDVWVTAVKKQDGPGVEGLAVRLFGVSAADQAAVTLALGVGAPLAGAAATDLIELNPSPLPGVAGGTTVALDVGHWAIETLVLDVDVGARA